MGKLLLCHEHVTDIGSLVGIFIMKKEKKVIGSLGSGDGESKFPGTGIWVLYAECESDFLGKAGQGQETAPSSLHLSRTLW